jgi:phosphopantothenoylcysteine synthetase/decarboxylase
VEQTHVGGSTQSCFLTNRNVIVTCGPSYEPIDEVRRITNSSTGELGVLLAQHLAKVGWEVLCCKGSGATFPGPEPPVRLSVFQTNDDLLRLLQTCARAHAVAAVFHGAALCDYRVKDVRDDRGSSMPATKIASRAGSLHLVLEPATKILAALRDLFPASLLVGWKYELAGTRAEALDKARRQILECRSNACVVNGRAFGPGFGFCRSTGELAELENKPALVWYLVNWLAAEAGLRFPNP